MRDARKGLRGLPAEALAQAGARKNTTQSAYCLLPCANRIPPTAYRTLLTLTISEQSPAPQGPNMPALEPPIFSKPRGGETIVSYEEGAW